MLNLIHAKAALEAVGMTVTMGESESGREALDASIETKRGMLTVFAIAEGARLQKPNGSSKYLYGCSNGQLSATVRQTIKANR